MYDFLFYFYYNFLKKLKADDPDGNAVGLVLVSISGHMFLIISGINYFFDINIAQEIFGKGSSKYVALPFVITLIAIVYRIYKTRKERVFEKYRSREMFTPLSILIALSLLIIPFLLAIYLLNNS